MNATILLAGKEGRKESLTRHPTLTRHPSQPSVVITSITTVLGYPNRVLVLISGGKILEKMEKLVLGIFEKLEISDFGKFGNLIFWVFRKVLKKNINSYYLLLLIILPINGTLIS